MAHYTTVLGMDPLAFFLAVVSCLGLAVSTLSFLRTYTPTNLYLYTADSVAQTRILYERLESEDLFSSEAHCVNHLGSHLDKLEDDIKALMFVVVPTSNVFRKLATWLRVWQLLYLAFGVDKLRIGLQTVFHQRRRMERELARAQRQGVVVDVEQLKAHVTGIAEMFISSLADTAPSLSTKDLELKTGFLAWDANADQPERKSPKLFMRMVSSGHIPAVQDLVVLDTPQYPVMNVIHKPPRAYSPGYQFSNSLLKSWRPSRYSRPQSVLPT